MNKVQQVINRHFTSNTYIITHTACKWVWLVDIVSFNDVLDFLPTETRIRGVFITHAHYDHIIGINELINKFPNCKIFISEYGKDGLYSERLNLSFYHDNPIRFSGLKVEVLNELSRVKLFRNTFLEVIETPGHNPGCLSYKVGNYIFTGDSYIPFYPVVTKLKGGSKELSILSLNKLIPQITSESIVCPGHGPMFPGSSLQSDLKMD